MVKSKKHSKEKNEFLDAVHDIHLLATQRMDVKARREFMAKEAQKLGARVKKNPKIPYNIYQGILKKQRQIEETAKADFQLSRDCNFFNPVHKRQTKRKPRNPQPTGPSVGKYKFGTLFIQKPV